MKTLRAGFVRGLVAVLDEQFVSGAALPKHLHGVRKRRETRRLESQRVRLRLTSLAVKRETVAAEQSSRRGVIANQQHISLIMDQRHQQHSASFCIAILGHGEISTSFRVPF